MPFGGPSTNRLCIFDFTWSVDDSMNLRIFAMDQVDFLWMILSISKSMCILFTDLRKKTQDKHQYLTCIVCIYQLIYEWVSLH